MTRLFSSRWRDEQRWRDCSAQGGEMNKNESLTPAQPPTDGVPAQLTPAQPPTDGVPHTTTPTQPPPDGVPAQTTPTQLTQMEFQLKQLQLNYSQMKFPQPL